MTRLFPMLTMGFLALIVTLHALPGFERPEERFKAIVNQMVQDVKQADSPDGKRKILSAFLARMETTLEKTGGALTLSEKDKQEAEALLAKFRAYASELAGKEGFDRVADGDLNRFALYVQQDLEQAHRRGGIYISAGTLIVVLIILLLVV